MEAVFGTKKEKGVEGQNQRLTGEHASSFAPMHFKNGLVHAKLQNPLALAISVPYEARRRCMISSASAQAGDDIARA